jgi:4-hydroxythreonine-4-phosphate dehydrogenase
MAFVAPQIVVTLATTHIPLRDVPDALTTEKIVTAAALTNDFLAKKFAAGTERRERPCIAVCGLNPHCGDGGIFGSEEEKIIYPAIEELSSIGIDAAGPCPADSVFFRALKGEFDAVVAMYHDQGLAVVKTLANETAVNVTLGLPIIRTSVDHGTAEDIAWKGVASDANLIAAIEMAIGLKGWV